MAGLALACGGASALNHVLDADIDRLMGERTEKRPVAAGRVPPARALEFGLALSALSFVLLASTVNVLTAALALVGNLFYVLVYTRWLKRSTPQNIVIGGAAGAVPAARRLRRRDREPRPAGALALPDRLPLDAAALLGARAPDQGALRGGEACRCCRSCAASAETTRQIVLYSLVLVALHARRRLLARPGLLGRGRCCSAASSSALAWQLRREHDHARNAGVLFHYSLALPRAALRGSGSESGAPVKELTPELERKNLLLGWALFGVFLLLFAGTVGVALLYLALD